MARQDLVVLEMPKFISVILIVILHLPAPKLQAQALSEHGFKGGLNISRLGTVPTEYTFKLSYHLGLFYTYQPYQEIAFQVETLYSRQGARHRDIADLRLVYNYLNIPFTVKFFFSDIASIDAGLQPGILLSATRKDGDQSFNINENVRTIDFSGIIGLSVTKPYGSIGMRYALGINNTNSASLSAEIKFSNQVFQFFVAKTLGTRQ